MEDPMYRDDGIFKTISEGNRKNSRVYECWQHIRGRCYMDPKKYPAYVDCTVSPDFYSFQAFAAWAVQQIGFEEGLQIDKDLLLKGNRVYSPATCVFLPREINSALMTNKRNRGDLPIGVRLASNQPNRPFRADMSKNHKKVQLGSFSTPSEAFVAYKLAKEAHIKELALKHKANIDPRAYVALMNYTIEITD